MDTRPATGRDHAVVIGASMAGLLAARVLSDHFAQVTVVDRDLMPTPWANRRGVPQGWHVHTLLPRGRQTIERLFPGITEELSGGGAPLFDDLADLRFQVLGHLVTRRQHAFPDPVLQASRPYLEGRTRARVTALPNVEVRDVTTVVGPRHTEDRSRITGVHLACAEGAETLEADLVVDTSGKAARTQTWLEELGYQRPPEDELRVRLTYVSQPLRLAPGHGLEPLVFYGMRPGRPRGFGLFAYENDTSTLTVAGLGDAAPDVDHGSMLAAIEPFAPAEVLTALAGATPLGEPVAYRYPASRRRRYEKLRRFPRGLLVMGDAVCSFNPVYGQGMTVAAIEADVLDDVLARSRDDGALPRRFLERIATPVGVAWQLATGSDLALPEVEGQRTRQVLMVNAWVDRVLAAAESDPQVAEAFFRVSGLLDPPSLLMRPSTVARVLRTNRRRRRTTPKPRVPAAPVAG